MKKLLDKKLIKVCSLLLLLGVLFGIIFLICTSKVDKIIIKSEINDYFDMFNSNNISLSNFLNSFKYNLLYVFIISLLSLVYIFSPLILFVNFYKGMQIGFLISSIIYTFKLKGIYLSLLLLFPHQIIMSLLIIVYSSIMINYSIKLFKIVKEGENFNIKLFLKRVLILFSASLIVCLISSLLEIFLNSFLMNIVL